MTGPTPVSTRTVATWAAVVWLAAITVALLIGVWAACTPILPTPDPDDPVPTTATVTVCPADGCGPR